MKWTKRQAALFLMEDRSRLRRLVRLGVYGHQPGIAAHLETTPDEDDVVVESILAQKVGSNPKTLKDLKTFAARNGSEHEDTVRVRIARLMTRTVVRWRRKRNNEVQQQQTHCDLQQPRLTEIAVEDQRQHLQQMPKYSNRLIACSRCGEKQETRNIQLRTIVGYRALHCKACKKQERCAKSMCACGQVWHRCKMHRIDPPTHSSRKGR